MNKKTESRVLVETTDGIAVVSLNRPEKHNGLDLPMFHELVDAARALKRDRAVRAVVMHGNGPSFCAGLDFASVSRDRLAPAKLFLKWPWQRTNLAQRVAEVWRTLPAPVIAAIHGNCFGGGLQIALAADYRFAVPDSQLSVMEGKWGLVPDMSATVTLSRLTRIDIAQELTMTARVFDAREAHEFGLVSRLSENPLQDARALADRIAAQSPDAVAAAKLLFRKAWKRGDRAALRIERFTQARIAGRPNQRTAMKRARSGDNSGPDYTDRKFR